MEHVDPRHEFPDQERLGISYGYNSSSSSIGEYTPPQRPQEPSLPVPRHSQSLLEAAQATTQTPPAAPHSQDGSAHSSSTVRSGHSRRRTMTPEERRKARTCVVDGCSNYIVDRRRCFRHGGGKRCSIDGCNSSAKQLGLCWQHGGSVPCKVEGCNRGVKAKGLCWGHGSGKKKQAAGATLQATNSPTDDTSGPRCIFDGCQSAPTLHSFCDRHAQEVGRPGFIFEL